LYAALDLAVHWTLTTFEIDKDQRATIEQEWNGPIEQDRNLPKSDAWAPSWWSGDDDAAVSALAAAANLGRGR
jgi:hypothetical protein